MKEKFLPIGSIVMLRGGEKKVMIVSYLIFPSNDPKSKKIFDYGGCTYPEGIVDSRVGIGFNHSDIAELLHEGYEDEEFKEMNKLLNEHAEEVKKQFIEATEKGE